MVAFVSCQGEACLPIGRKGSSGSPASHRNRHQKAVPPPAVAGSMPEMSYLRRLQTQRPSSRFENLDARQKVNDLLWRKWKEIIGIRSKLSESSYKLNLKLSAFVGCIIFRAPGCARAVCRWFLQMNQYRDTDDERDSREREYH